MTIKTSFELYIEIVETPLHLVPAEDGELTALLELEEENVMTMEEEDDAHSAFDYEDDSSVESFSCSSDDEDESENYDELHLVNELSRFFSERDNRSAAAPALRAPTGITRQAPRRVSSSSSEDSIILASRRGVRRLERGDSLVLARGRVRPLPPATAASTTTDMNDEEDEYDLSQEEVVILPLNDCVDSSMAYIVPLTGGEEEERMVPLSGGGSSHTNNSDENKATGGQPPRRRRGPRDSILRRYPSIKSLREQMDE